MKKMNWREKGKGKGRAGWEKERGKGEGRNTMERCSCSFLDDNVQPSTCQIAWLPWHHFLVLLGCLHSRGLLLAHGPGMSHPWARCSRTEILLKAGIP